MVIEIPENRHNLIYYKPPGQKVEEWIGQKRRDANKERTKYKEFQEKRRTWKWQSSEK